MATMTSSRILVTGATGFIGVEVARQLADADVSVRLMIHRPHRAQYVTDYSRDIIVADLRDEASLVRAVAGVDAVIHLAGRATFEPYALLHPTIVAGTASLARAAAAAGVARFVFASSTTVYDGEGGPADERTPPHPWSGYGRAKLDAERALAAVAATGPFVTGILRLPHVYGARDAMFAMVRRGLLVSPGRGDAPFSHLHVEDAACALIRAADIGWQGTSPVADDRPASWREFIALIRANVPSLRELRVPATLARAGAALTATLARVRGRPTLLTPDGVAGWNRSLVVAPGTLWPALGIVPRYRTIESGVPAAARDVPPTGWLHPLNDQRGARRDAT